MKDVPQSSLENGKIVRIGFNTLAFHNEVLYFEMKYLIMEVKNLAKLMVIFGACTHIQITVIITQENPCVSSMLQREFSVYL